MFGFLCDPKLSLGVKFIAADPKVPIYVMVEHLMQLGAEQMYPYLEDEDSKQDLKRFLMPALTGNV